MNRVLLSSAVLAAWMLVTGAVSAQAPGVSLGAASDEKFQKFLSSCRTKYAEADQRIDAGGVRDGTFYRVPGFPYLRTDRLLSSFHDELKDLNTLGTWMLQLREYDSIAREAELTNLGLSNYDRSGLLNDLRVCAVWMSYTDWADEALQQKLLNAVHVPDDYPAASTVTTAQRQLVAARRSAVQARFSRPLDAKASLTQWQPQPVEADVSMSRELAAAARDELGRMGLLMNVWSRLAALHAPRLLLENERLGAPALQEKSVTVDTSTPVVHYLAGHARFQGRLLVQISYVLWLPTADGRADSLVWRVTLNEQGEPLLYDSVRGSGLDAMWFPTSTIKPRIAAGDEAALLPQPVLPAQPFALRLEANHALMRLQSMDAVPAANTQIYELRPYDELSMLTRPQGGSASLFNAAGVLVGSGNAEDTQQLQAAGLTEWGPVRQLSHLPVGLIVHRHFDDPFLMDSLFESH